MPKKDPRIDAYIAKAAPFARPILKHLRKLVHQGCPDAQETIKWSSPFFDHHGIMIGIAAFKEHCALIFWKGTLLPGGRSAEAKTARGQFGRIRSLEDLPPDATIVRLVKEAARLNEAGVPSERGPKAPKKPPARVPAELKAALAKNQQALATFTAFAPSHKRDYIEWIVSAKRPETRATRLKTAIAWMAEGKTHNWKYQRK